ncbi:hypothetical protein Glove_117g177 [Diversispora epigaea]|uniref:Protein kinase domain-containing protein n=1 Tax=Diversispora epigaea TaxID=1348612 RepID=A0A397J0H3_9GLOM|nr:hypothetical protein Glove_117g177 [Diversispora epigaea]
MSLEKTNEEKWETLMSNLIIEDTFQREKIPFYQCSEFVNVKLISKNVYEATFKTFQKIIALKYISLNDKFTLDNLINEIKRHRKLEIHDSILKFYGITKQENINNYMIILEYVNEGSLRQYLKTHFQKLDWNAKLNLAKQIANVLMHLHSNNTIHGKFNSENILIHNGIIKLNVFGLTKIISNSLSFLTNNLGPMQYTDPQHLDLFKNKSSDIYGLGIILWEISSGYPPFVMESSSNVDSLNNIVKGKREIAIPGTPQRYEKIYTDCWKPNGNSRPDISQIVKNLSEITIYTSVEFGAPQSQPYNVTDIKLDDLNIQNQKPEIKPYSPFFDATMEVNVFIKDLFELFIDLFNRQFRETRPITIKNYIREHKKNPYGILFEMIRHPYYYWFTSLLGFFYQYGIGTIADNQMAFKFYNLAANQIINASSFPSSFKKLYNVNKEIGNISLANMYSDGLGVEKDTKKAFQIYYKLASKGSLMALNSVAYCYSKGLAQLNVGWCYENGLGIKKDKTKGFHFYIKSARAGNDNAMCDTAYSYGNGIGVYKDEKEAIKWYLKAAEKGHYMAQDNLGWSYNDGIGINRDYKKAFEWFKIAAENNFADSQYMLGKYFYEGYGIKKDIVNAIYWLDKAKDNGSVAANELLKEIIRNMMQ